MTLAGKSDRDVKLAKLQAELLRYGTKRRLELEAEAKWIEKLLAVVGGTIGAELENRESLGVVDEISEFLK